MKQSQDSRSSFNADSRLASIESAAMLSVVAEPEKDANQQALEQVEKANYRTARRLASDAMRASAG